MTTRHRNTRPILLARPTPVALALVTAGLLCTMPAHVQAQQAADRADQDTSQTIVITANKRLEKQREVAGTVSVLGGSDLERRGARDQEDTLKLAPGVQSEGMVACAWDTAVYDGALDGMRVLVVAPGTSGESALLPEVADAEASEALRMQAFFPKSRESWMQVSDCAVRVIAPAGTGHNFPYEKPQFVVELMINEVRRDQAVAPPTEAVS